MKKQAVIIFMSFFIFSFAYSAENTSASVNKHQYYQKQVNSENKQLLRSILQDINLCLSTNFQKPNTAKALELKAEIQEKLSLYKSSVVTLLKYRYLYPESKNSFNIKNRLNRLIDKKISKKLRPALRDLTKKNKLFENKETALYSFLTDISKVSGNYFYDPLTEEFYVFFEKYPASGKTDELLISLGNLEVYEENFKSAIFHYEKVEKFYPESAHLANSKLMLAKVYSENLKKYNAAIEIYQSVADKFPSSKWASSALENMAKIAEKEEQYTLAVETYDKIVKLFPLKDTAHNAMLAKARILNEEFEDPDSAIIVFKEINSLFKGEKGISALWQAAEIAEEELKDYNLQIEMYQTIAKDYPNSAAAPNALYKAAFVYEEELKNPEKALEIYSQIVLLHSGNSAAVKAQRRIDKLG